MAEPFSPSSRLGGIRDAFNLGTTEIEDKFTVTLVELFSEESFTVAFSPGEQINTNE